MKIDPNRTGLTLGLTFVLLHFTWLILFILGIGDLWFKWTQGLHFTKVEYEMLSFNPLTALLGLIGAFILGYLVGAVFGFIWKQLEK